MFLLLFCLYNFFLLLFASYNSNDMSLYLLLFCSYNYFCYLQVIIVEYVFTFAIIIVFIFQCLVILMKSSLTYSHSYRFGDINFNHVMFHACQNMVKQKKKALLEFHKIQNYTRDAFRAENYSNPSSAKENTCRKRTRSQMNRKGREGNLQRMLKVTVERKTLITEEHASPDANISQCS